MWLPVLVIVLLFGIGTSCFAIDIYLDICKNNNNNNLRFVPESIAPLKLTRTYEDMMEEDITDADIAYEYEFLEK